MANEVAAREPGTTGANAALKLLGIFLIAFLLVFAFAWVWDAFSEQFQRQQLEAAPSTGQAVLVVDPNIEKELAKVLSYEVTEASESGADLKNPFADRNNLSNAAARSYSSLPSRSQLGPATSGSQISGNTGGSSGGATRASGSSGSGGNASGAEEKIDIKEETMQALQRRDARIRAGYDAGPQSAAFFIDDLLPVGMVSGGSKAPEVIMYSISMERTYSFPAGAVFRDGWLATWRSDGVAFGDATRNGAIFLKPWSSNTSGKGDSRQIVIDPVSGNGSSD